MSVNSEALASQLTTVSLLAAAARTANANGSAVDTENYTGKLLVIGHSGNITAGDANSTYTVKIISSEDTNISNGTEANVNVAFTNAGSVQTATVDKRAVNRYIFAQGNITGANSPSFPCGVTIVAQKKYQ